MDKIRFLHCSDIHLGANPYCIKERFEDMGNVFEYVGEKKTNKRDMRLWSFSRKNDIEL